MVGRRRRGLPRRLTVDDLTNIKRTLTFVGRSQIDGVNYSSIGRNLGITKYAAERYVIAMERAFLLRRAIPAGTTCCAGLDGPAAAA